MKNFILPFLFAMCALYLGCKARKPSVASAPVTVKDTIIVAASRCDTLAQHIWKNENKYRPRFMNINPDEQVWTVRNSNQEDIYIIEVRHYSIYDGYELYFDDIKIDFAIGDKNCEMHGESIYLYVDQSVLGKQCVAKGLSNGTKNIYDCIYHHDWNLKVRGIYCNNLPGPYSDILEKVSFQCVKPE